MDKVERIDFDLIQWESSGHFMLAFGPMISRREDTYLPIEIKSRLVNTVSQGG